MRVSGADWTIWVGRILATLWAGWWIFFGVASGIAERASPMGIFIHTLMPGLIFGLLILLAWKWEGIGGTVLVVISLVVTAGYPWMMFRNRPIRWDWYGFILLTMALPPLLAGLLMLWRKRIGRAAAVAGSLLILGGCGVPSLDPLYTEKDIVSDPGIVGQWVDDDAKDSMVVRVKSEGIYEWRTIENGKATEPFELRLVQIGDYRFYDLFPEGKPEGSEFWRDHFAPVHTFGRVVRDGDTLRAAGLSEDFLKKAAQPPAWNRERGILTAPTKELQSFARTHAADAQAFADWGTWVRKK